jgi:hypothetical protein
MGHSEDILAKLTSSTTFVSKTEFYRYFKQKSASEDTGIVEYSQAEANSSYGSHTTTRTVEFCAADRIVLLVVEEMGDAVSASDPPALAA